MTTRIASPSRTRLIALIAAAIAAATLLVAGLGAATASADSIPRESYVKSGGYRTLATLWNVSRKAEFQCPAGAKIRILYGFSIFSKTRQNQTLDCVTVKRLEVSGAWSKVGARLQIKVPQTGIVRWGYVVEGP
jgi:hypothetical protein